MIFLVVKEGWAPRNWWFWTVVLEKPLQSPLDCKEIKLVNPKGNQLTEKTDAEAEAPILWPPDVKSQLIWKDPYAGKDWGQEKKRATEDKMVGWHHRLNGLSLSKVQEILKDREAWHAAVHGVTKSLTRLSDWTATQGAYILLLFHLTKCLVILWAILMMLAWIKYPIILWTFLSKLW